MSEPLKKILVVDDEENIRELMQAFLESEGYVALTASQAREALSIISLENPQLVLLDVVMPDMDGISCLKEIKKISPKTVVVMVSGIPDEGLAKEAIRYGAYEYCLKPLDFTYLQNNILSRVF